MKINWYNSERANHWFKKWIFDWFRFGEYDVKNCNFQFSKLDVSYHSKQSNKNYATDWPIIRIRELRWIPGKTSH